MSMLGQSITRNSVLLAIFAICTTLLIAGTYLSTRDRIVLDKRKAEEQALLEALQRGVIAGAGIDVYDQEPLPADHPLRSAPGAILTSHVGYVTRQTYDVFYSETVECLEAYLNGEPVRVLNPA